MHTPQRMVFGPVVMTDGCRQSHQIPKLALVLQGENALLRPHAETDFLIAVKSSRIVRHASLRKFKAVPAK